MKKDTSSSVSTEKLLNQNSDINKTQDRSFSGTRLTRLLPSITSKQKYPAPPMPCFDLGKSVSNPEDILKIYKRNNKCRLTSGMIVLVGTLAFEGVFPFMLSKFVRIVS